MAKKLIVLLTIIFTCTTLLFAGTYSGGSGTSGAPYQIATTADLIELSNTAADWVAGKYFEQTANIAFDPNEQLVDWDGDGTADWDAEDQLGFSRIGNGSNEFKGNYDGNEKSLSNIYMNRSGSSNGIFGQTRDATIQDLTIINADVNFFSDSYKAGIFVGNCIRSTVNNIVVSGGSITASEGVNGTVGAVAGYIYGATFQNCTSSASVTYDGTGYSIGGFVGAAFETGTPWHLIQNCSASGNVTITGSAQRFGGFAGTLSSSGGVTRQCYANNTISASSATVGGGFVGYLSESIYNCYATGDISASSWVGGFVGTIYSNPEDCYSTGKPTGSSWVGGFCGYNNGGSSTNCFWNTTTSERSNATGAGTLNGTTGKITAEMQDYTTFTNAGWDFEVETTNGSNNYWDIDLTGTINSGYPFLSWQNGEDTSLPVELSSFTANTTREDEIELVWVTESEIENIGFILERRETNEESWREIASYLTESTLQGQGSVTYRTEYRYTDNTVEPNTQYDYRLADVSYTGEKTYHAVTVLGIEAQSFPEAFRLQPAYPNPFNPTTTIQYELINDGQVTLKIYDIQGREVTTLINQHRQSGFHTAQWNADTHSSGTYFIQLTQGNNTTVQKIILLK